MRLRAGAVTVLRGEAVTAPFPKIELHVHIEGTVRPERLLQIARRNDYPLPFDTVEELADLYRFRDFAHFIQTWILVTNALRRPDDFREILVDYAAEAASYGAVYLEAIFSPAERVRARRRPGTRSSPASATVSTRRASGTASRSA